MSEKHESYADVIDVRPNSIEHVHRYVPNGGSVSIKVEHNSRGTNWEIKIDKPIELDAIATGYSIVTDIGMIEREIRRQIKAQESETE